MIFDNTIFSLLFTPFEYDNRGFEVVYKIYCTYDTCTIFVCCKYVKNYCNIIIQQNIIIGYILYILYWDIKLRGT